MRGKYDRARELLSPALSMELVFERGLDCLLDRKDPARRAARRMSKRSGADPQGPPTDSRRIPVPLRDAVWARDGGRCVFLSPEGARCPGTENLEIDHILPYAFGGRSDDAANLRLLCRAHNQLAARRIFGRRDEIGYPQG